MKKRPKVHNTWKQRIDQKHSFEIEAVPHETFENLWSWLQANVAVLFDELLSVDPWPILGSLHSRMITICLDDMRCHASRFKHPTDF